MAENITQDRRHHRQAAGERDGFDYIDELTCWALLSSTPVGRVGVVVDGAAEIYPVNHVVDRHPNGALTVVFRTDPGTKLAGLAGTPGVCFEVDGVDPEHQSGWSVLVKGRARQVRELADPEERDRVEQLTVGTWDPGPKRHWIRIEPTEVTGRRIGPLPSLPYIRTVPAFADRTHGELPSLADWSERDVWVPPPHTDGTVP